MSWPKVVNLPRTQTILAFGVLAGCFWSMIDWHDMMLVIIGYYFGREMPRPVAASDPVRVSAPSGSSVSVTNTNEGDTP